MLSKAYISGKLSFAPLSSKKKVARIIQGISSLALFALLIWAVNQAYLNITSLFPIVSIWLGYSLLLSAAILLLSALIVEIDGNT